MNERNMLNKAQKASRTVGNTVTITMPTPAPAGDDKTTVGGGEDNDTNAVS